MNFDEDAELFFSPSDLTAYWDSEFTSWMDRWYLEKRKGANSVTNGNGLPIGIELGGIEKCEPDEEDEQLKLIAQKGMEHEKAYLKQLQENGNDVVVIKSGKFGTQQTLDSMNAGASYIYQAQIAHQNLGGKADFLVKSEGDSSLGAHHYEVWDTKLSKTPKASFIIQLCAYAEILEQIQQRRPNGFEVVLGDNEHQRFRTNDFRYYFRAFKRNFLRHQDQFDYEKFPHPGLSSRHGRWSTFASQILEASDHLSRVANITRTQIKKLEDAGIQGLAELANTDVLEIPRIPQPTFERLVIQAKLQVLSKGKQHPLYELQSPPAETPARGIASLPPESSLDVFFDIEGFPLREGGLEYLLGATYIEDGKPHFADWWAHDEQQEKLAFEKFIDWAFTRWQADPSMHIYHYAVYEVTAMKRLAGKYAAKEHEVDEFLRNHVFVDLYNVVRQGLIVGTPSYSLKDIEHLYLEPRKGGVTTAGGSVVEYHHWIESRESQDWKESPILKEIRDYNQVDCDSTWKLAEWLRDLQTKKEIQYIPPESSSSASTEGDPEEEHPSKTLASKILNKVDSGALRNEDSKKVHQLLAWLLEFHWREDKPVFWKKFDRHEKTEQDLIADLDCLGGLQRTEISPEQIKKSFLYQYKFDPNQETKLHVGSRCFFAHDLKARTTIERLDTNQGLVEIKLGPSVKEEPTQFSLIPDEHIRSDVISNAVFRYVDSWSDGTVISSAIDDLIHRRPPRIHGHEPGPLIPEGAELLPTVVDLISRMDRTLLCVQGPPGTGKTFTAAQAILKLLRQGKKVAVTANSHKAILNVLHAVHAAVEKAGEEFSLYKIGNSADDLLIQRNEILHIPNSADAAGVMEDGPLVMGGTAWVFSRPELQGAFDYLFIDEAGQFSIADTIATGLSADNIVLVGDQMQLSQPTMGTHPGESGKSALEYLLGEHATIPPEYGVFLNQTWRLNPDICRFISEAVYENRLVSHPDTSHQEILLPEGASKILSQGSGIVYVSVSHEGNTQSSEEEAEIIERIVNDLLGHPVKHFGGKDTSSLSLDDILLVAPFNMQVRLLQNRLGDQARIGSVDKFQGQEAQVVIVSMCSSTLEDSPRGAEFLFDPNRINVAISRAQSLVVVVGSPDLLNARCQTIKEMELLNLYCWLLEHAKHLELRPCLESR